MSAEDSTDDGFGRGQLLLVAGLALALLSGVVVAATGTSQTDQVGVTQSIVGGDRFESLSETATERLRPALENGSDPAVVNGSEFRRSFPGFPSPWDLYEGDRYFVEYGGRFYGVGLNETTSGTYSIEVTDETETVRIEYAELPAEVQGIVDRAASSDGPINVSEMPPIDGADGLATSVLGGRRLYYLARNGSYYTVVVYRPVEVVEGPTGGQILGGLGFVVGTLLALVGGGLALRE